MTENKHYLFYFFPLSLHFHLFVFVCLSVCLSVCLCVCLSLCLCVCLAMILLPAHPASFAHKFLCQRVLESPGMQ